MPEWNWDKHSKLLLVIGPKQEGIVLHCVGAHIQHALEGFGPNADELGFDVSTPGLFVFEGKFEFTNDPDINFGPDCGPVGTLRPPNEDELKALMEGRSPWDSREWLIDPPALPKE